MSSQTKETEGASESSTTKTRELVRRAQDGDRASLTALLDRYRPLLCRWASGRVPKDLRALLETEDLVHDAMLKTITRVDRLRSDGAFQNYLRSIILNKLRDEIRRHRPVPLDPERPAPDRSPSPAEQASKNELMRLYEAALQELPERDRAAVVERFEWGLSFREIADDLDYPTPDAARMAVSRALVDLGRKIRHVERL